MDEHKHILRKSFRHEGKKSDQIKDVPMRQTLQEVFDYVSAAYFEPPLGELEAYEYEGKHGHGEPVLLGLGTTISKIRRHQKRRKVADDRLTLIAKAELSAEDIKERYFAKRRALAKEQAETHGNTPEDNVARGSSSSAATALVPSQASSTGTPLSRPSAFKVRRSAAPTVNGSAMMDAVTEIRSTSGVLIDSVSLVRQELANIRTEIGDQRKEEGRHHRAAEKASRAIQEELSEIRSMIGKQMKHEAHHQLANENTATAVKEDLNEIRDMLAQLTIDKGEKLRTESTDGDAFNQHISAEQYYSHGMYEKATTNSSFDFASSPASGVFRSYGSPGTSVSAGASSGLPDVSGYLTNLMDADEYYYPRDASVSTSTQLPTKPVAVLATVGDHSSKPLVPDEAAGDHSSKPLVPDEAAGDHSSKPLVPDEAAGDASVSTSTQLPTKPVAVLAKAGDHSSKPLVPDEAAGDHSSKPLVPDEAAGDHSSKPVMPNEAAIAAVQGKGDGVDSNLSKTKRVADNTQKQVTSNRQSRPNAGNPPKRYMDEACELAAKKKRK